MRSRTTSIVAFSVEMEERQEQETTLSETQFATSRPARLSVFGTLGETAERGVKRPRTQRLFACWFAGYTGIVPRTRVLEYSSYSIVYTHACMHGHVYIHAYMHTGTQEILKF